MPSFCYLARNRAIYAMIRLPTTAEHQAIKKIFIFAKKFYKKVLTNQIVWYKIVNVKRTREPRYERRYENEKE